MLIPFSTQISAYNLYTSSSVVCAIDRYLTTMRSVRLRTFNTILVLMSFKSIILETFVFLLTSIRQGFDLMESI